MFKLHWKKVILSREAGLQQIRRSRDLEVRCFTQLVKCTEMMKILDEEHTGLRNETQGRTTYVLRRYPALMTASTSTQIGNERFSRRRT